ncbi:MAG: response regulator transcription factor [Alphaproteobacteria bacterium]|nr:response regulator transcription factor [Alphaproteobacteria bacterium]
MAEQTRILIVEDEAVTRDLIATLLRKEYAVTPVADAAAALAQLKGGRFDLLVLDLNLPDGDGLALARELGPRPGPAVIIVTARSDDVDRIVGLELGADDYITKPFNPRELMARIKAVLRRMQAPAPIAAAPDGAPAAVTFDGWALDMASRSLTDPKGKDVHLTRAEFDLLAVLATRAGRAQTRDQLLDAIAGRESAPFDRTIDVLIARLRRKIEVDPKSPKLILTMPGFGYKFAEAAAPAAKKAKP